MFSRRVSLPVAGVLCAFSLVAVGQSERHGRKYKAPPETSHFEVLVLKDANGKVLENAAVIFHPTKDGDDEGNLEVKSGVDGKAFIDIIPTGSKVAVQVIANGYATYSGSVNLMQPSQSLTVRMLRPQAQVSSYEDNSGKGSTRVVGVQEPNHKTLVAAPPKKLTGTDPVLRLPGMPDDPKAQGDPTIPGDHTVTPPVQKPAKQANKSSSPTGPTVGGTASGSPSNP